MSWIILVISGLFEAVWATALGKIEGWHSVGAITAYVLGSIISLGGLWWAMKELPTGTAYAVWTGVGTVGAVVVGMLVLGEPRTVARGACIGLILAGVAGLKLAGR